MKLNWGIVGAGRISSDFVKAIGILPPSEHKVTAVAASSKEKAMKFALQHDIPTYYDSYEELVKDKVVGVIYIGTINPFHYETAKLMLNHGKHVLCEKPLCMNQKETEELINIAKSKNLFLMEGVWSRFFPAYKHLRMLLDSGGIGEPLMVQANFGTISSTKDRIRLKELGGGTILDLGVYVLQFAMFVFGHEPESVVGVGHLNPEGVDESATYTLKYPNGKLATMTTHSRVKLRNSAMIYGTKGFIEVCEPFWCPTTIESSQGKFFSALPGIQEGYNFQNSSGLSYEAEEVRKCIQEGKIESPWMTHLDSLTLSKFEDCIRKSIGVVFSQDQ